MPDDQPPPLPPPLPPSQPAPRRPSDDDEPPGQKSAWRVVLVITCLAALIFVATLAIIRSHVKRRESERSETAISKATPEERIALLRKQLATSADDYEARKIRRQLNDELRKQSTMREREQRESGERIARLTYPLADATRAYKEASDAFFGSDRAWLKHSATSRLALEDTCAQLKNLADENETLSQRYTDLMRALGTLATAPETGEQDRDRVTRILETFEQNETPYKSLRTAETLILNQTAELLETLRKEWGNWEYREHGTAIRSTNRELIDKTNAIFDEIRLLEQQRRSAQAEIRRRGIAY